MLLKLLLLALAGSLGTLARFGLGSLVQERSGSGFPYGTLAVNALGCFLFGAVWCLAEERLVVSGETRRIILTGFMGAFTTFSSFAFETGQMLRESQWLLAGCNIVLQNVLGIALFFAGLAAGKWL